MEFRFYFVGIFSAPCDVLRVPLFPLFDVIMIVSTILYSFAYKADALLIGNVRICFCLEFCDFILVTLLLLIVVVVQS